MNFDHLFLSIFTLTLIILTIYCFKAKKYLYLFMPCFLFLPDYYGIEISESLPLLTVKRIMLIFFILYSYANKRRAICLKKSCLKSLPKQYYLLGGYFLFRIISNLFYIFSYSQALKTIFVIIFEQMLLISAFYVLFPTKEEIKMIIKSVVYAATALFIVGIIESIASIRPFDALYTVSRYVLNERYVRLGFLRSTTTMGLPGLFGNMCILILPLILYMYETFRQKRYLFSVGLCFMAIVHSGCRADYIFFLLVILVYFIYVLQDKKRRELFIQNSLAVIGAVFLVMFTTSLISPYYKYLYVGNAKSVLNEIGFDFDLSEGAPDEDTNYGTNAVSGGQSRTRQLTALFYTSKINPIFGLGSGAQTRHQVVFVSTKGDWRKEYTYDIGIVEIFCDEGLFGLVGMMLLLVYMVVASFDTRWLKMLTFVYALTTLSTINMFAFLFLYVVLIFISRQTQDS